MSEPTLFYDSMNRGMATSNEEKLLYDAVALLKNGTHGGGGGSSIKHGTITPADDEITLSDILDESYGNCFLIVASAGRDTSLGASALIGALFIGTTVDEDLEVKPTITTTVNPSATGFSASNAVAISDLSAKEGDTLDFTEATLTCVSPTTMTGVTYDWYAW